MELYTDSFIFTALRLHDLWSSYAAEWVWAAAIHCVSALHAANVEDHLLDVVAGCLSQCRLWSLNLGPYGSSRKHKRKKKIRVCVTGW